MNKLYKYIKELLWTQAVLKSKKQSKPLHNAYADHQWVTNHTGGNVDLNYIPRSL
mgnify:CR=1 FL=1